MRIRTTGGSVALPCPCHTRVLCRLSLHLPLPTSAQSSSAKVQVFSKIPRHNPDYFSDLGNACFAQGNFEAAVAGCREVIRLAPDGANGHCNLGTALFHLGKLDDAITAYREALRIKPDYAEA